MINCMRFGLVITNAEKVNSCYCDHGFQIRMVINIICSIWVILNIVVSVLTTRTKRLQVH